MFIAKIAICAVSPRSKYYAFLYHSSTRRLVRLNLIHNAIAVTGKGSEPRTYNSQNLFSNMMCFRLRLFENRVLRRKFGPKKDEVTVR
jgi:hypothetical protein